MIEQFENKLYEERRECVENILNDQSKDSESISVNAVTEPKCPWMMKIEYTAIRNREVHKASANIPVDLAMRLSNATISAILIDLLTKFRSD
jgi:hypothetical protein